VFGKVQACLAAEMRIRRTPQKQVEYPKYLWSSIYPS
jgi:hypothetical protein